MNERVVRPPVDREVDEEFAFHLEMRIRDLVAMGMGEREAKAEALRRFGDMDRVKADCRDLGKGRDVSMNRRLWWDEIRQDLTFAARQLRRSPSFAVVAILTLAVAIGANSAVFGVVNGVLLKPLAYEEPEELVSVWSLYLPPSGFDIAKFPLSGPEYLDFRTETAALESLGLWDRGSRTVTGGDQQPERVTVGFVSKETLPLLGVSPEHGRWFTPEEDLPGASPVVILGHGYWLGRTGGDPDIIGKTIQMNGVATEVVGVMPQGFSFPSAAEAWLPYQLDETNPGGRASHGLYALGRLAPGSTLADVDAELEVLKARWAAEFEHNEAHYLWAHSLHDEVVGDSAGILKLLMAAVALILLVACANVANLLLARMERRQGEVAVRSALGAGAGRITRQLVTESVVLAGVAAALGIGLAQIGIRALIALDDRALPRLAEVTLDRSVLLFTVGVALATALLFGVIPAHLAGRRARKAVASSQERAIGGRRRSGLRRALVAGEVALSLVVVILAGLLGRSFTALSASDPGLETNNLLTFSITLPSLSYPEDEQVPAEYDRLLSEVEAIPGVLSVTAATFLPFQGGMARWDFALNDRPARQDGELARNAGVIHAMPGYVETLGIPLLEGRDITRADGPEDPVVALVSETMANTYWPGESPLGKQFGYPLGDDSLGEASVVWMTVVGLIGDGVMARVDEETIPQVVVPQAQAGISTYYWPRTLRIAVRTGIEATTVTPAVRRAINEFDPALPLYDIATMEEQVSGSLSTSRLTANLLGTFALIALLLAAVGIYGVISYSVAGRTREIGVRVALGAGRRRIIRLILSEGASPVALGIAIGLGGAWFATELVASMLYGVAPRDTLTFTLVPLALLAIGLLATWMPAARATRISPMEALRDE